MEEPTKLTLTRKTARHFLYGSLATFGVFSLTFLFLPYLFSEASATQRVDALVDWGSVSLTFDPDVDATTSGDSAPGDAGHGDVNFGNLTPSVRSASNRGTMKVEKRTLGVTTTGKYYTVYLSSVDNETSLPLTASVDGEEVTHTSFSIPAIGDGSSTGTFSSPSHFGSTANWGYAVPGASSTGIPGASSAFVVPSLVGVQIDGSTDIAGASQTYNDTYWSGISSRSTPQQIWKSETNNVTGFDEGDSFDIYYGVMVNTDTLAGTYSKEIVYTALASAASLDRVSSNIAHSQSAGGRGDLVDIVFDLADSLGTITKSMVKVALVPHSVMLAHKTNLDEYTVSSLNFSDYKSCPIASFSHSSGNEYITLSCVLPDSEEGDQYDFWVKINGYNIDYVSKDYSGNNLAASFIYAGLQTQYPSSDPRSGQYAVTEMQEMTEGVCSLTNTWGNGTGMNARVYNYTGTGETLGTVAHDNDYLMNIGTFALTDNRDNKDYLVRRLADGNCWMVQNLDLDLASFAGTDNLTSENTDLNSKETWDPSASALAIAKTYDSTVTQENYFQTFSLNRLGITQNSQFQSGIERGGDYYWGSKVGDSGETLADVTDNAQAETPRSYDNGYGLIASYRSGAEFTKTNYKNQSGTELLTKSIRFTSGNYYESNTENTDIDHTTTAINNNHPISGTLDWLDYIADSTGNIIRDSTNYGTQYVGDYYNWYATTAESGTYAMSSGNAVDSICPSGWQLPTSGYEPGKSYNNLIFNTYKDINGNSMSNSVATSTSLHLSPLSFPFSGDYDWQNGGGLILRGYRALFASANQQGHPVTGGTLAGNFYFVANNVYPRNTYGNIAGYTVRCVARGTELPDDYEEEIATTCDAGKICYDGNTGGGEMADQSASSNTLTMLNTPTFVKTGYAFIGWNTEENGFGTTYGPNEIITTPDLSSKGLQLYAKWAPSSGTMQTWNSCSALEEHQVIGLTDARDGKTYSVAKLKDGACWMTSNLNLDLTQVSTLTNTDTDLNSKSSWTPDQSTIGSTLNGATTARYRQAPSIDQSYYNWYAATAESGAQTADNNDATDSICPSGWRMPTSKANTAKSYTELIRDYLGHVGKSSMAFSDNDYKVLSAYPFSLPFSGGFRVSDDTNPFIYYSSSTWASTNINDTRARYFDVVISTANSGYIAPAQSNLSTWGFTVRCVKR